MSTERPRARFVPTLTEVVLPAGDASPVGLPKAGDQRLDDARTETATPSVPVEAPQPSRSSVLELTVEGLLPQAREQLRQKLHAAAYALAEEQLHSMEDTLRQQLRAALREAAGMGGRS